ncbi:MAG: ChbG/HpnK family deacetylase [Anaerolineales bacterium]|nr:ChbG/HpnK family deacetylase [Anaerolineales bacterium]
MSIRLIVNSDDYGRSAEVARGIRQAHRNGIVTSTSCMMNMPTIAEDIHLALQETPRLGLGVHLVITSGYPLLPADQIPSITTAEGAFLSLAGLLDRLQALDVAQVKAEWRAQIEKLIAISGRTPTHLDSHHHSSYFTEPLFRAMLELAQEYGAAIRSAYSQGDGADLVGMPPETVPHILEFAPRLLAEFKPRTPDQFIATFYDEQATKDELLRLIDSLVSGTYEMMCHPGYVDAGLQESSGYADPRQRELTILTDAEVRQAIQVRQISLISFAEL